MSESNGGGAEEKPAPERLPTATIGDRVAEYYFPEKESFEFIFTNPDGKKFAIHGSMNAAVVVHEMCDMMFAQAHASKPQQVYFRMRKEATVTATEEVRNHMFVSMDGGMAYVLQTSVALKLAELIEQTARWQMTEEEWNRHLHKKAPLIIPPDRKRIIKP
jgi:hypothetical protein